MRITRRTEPHLAEALGEVTGSTIAQLNDTCGNLIQINQLARW